MSATHMMNPISGMRTNASQPGKPVAGSRRRPKMRTVTAAPTPKTTALINAAPTVRATPTTRPRLAGNTPIVAKAGNIMTPSRTTRYDPSNSRAETSRKGSAKSAPSDDKTA